MRDFFFPDLITLIKPDGTTHSDVRVQVNHEYILTQDAAVHFEADDKIIRPLENGREETLLVVDAHFSKSSSRSFKDHYRIEYSRGSSARKKPGMVRVDVSDSPQAHVNVGSTDHSVNVIIPTDDRVFLDLRRAIQDSLVKGAELDLLTKSISDMENNRGTERFTKAYKNFVQAAANHMTIVTPFLPMLTSLL